MKAGERTMAFPDTKFAESKLKIKLVRGLLHTCNINKKKTKNDRNEFKN